MTDSDPEAPSPEEQIMEATFRVLRRDGYAETSISKIADESGKSKATLYHHYDGKEDLLNHFLDYLLDLFDTELNKNTSDDPWARLERIIELSLPLNPDEKFLQILRAMLEFRLQSVHHSGYREKFEQTDSMMVGKLSDAIQEGIEAGEFRSVDPDWTARTLYTQIYGGHLLALTRQDQEVLYRTRRDVEEYVQQHLYQTEH